jgi:hypothetical protein
MKRYVAQTRSSGQRRSSERGAGVIEYLGLAAMAVGVIVALMAGMTDIGSTVLDSIRDMITG